MNIVSARIRNYRAIDDLTLSFTDATGAIRPVNVIVGPNGSGKTSALFAITQALRGVLGFRTRDVPSPSRDDIHSPLGGSSGWSESPPEAMVDVTLEFDQVEQDAVIYLAQKVNVSAPPKLSDGRLTVHWKYPPGFDRDGQRYMWWNSSVEPSLPSVRFWLQAKRTAIRALYEHVISLEEASKIGGFEFFPQDRNLLRRVVGERSTEDDPRSERDEDGSDDDDDLYRPGRHDRPVADILEQLAEYTRNREDSLPKEQDREDQIRKAFATVCHPKTYVGFLYRDGIGAPVFEDGKQRYPLSHAASGEQVILEYITRMIYRGTMQRSVVLIDEPEVHLHPKWIRQLYLALPRLGTSNQFIMTTHSEELRRRASAENCLTELGSLNGD